MSSNRQSSSSGSKEKTRKEDESNKTDDSSLERQKKGLKANYDQKSVHGQFPPLNPTADSTISGIPSIEELKNTSYDHEKTLNLLKEKVPLSDKKIKKAIQKDKEDDGYYPLDALEGSHLANAIETYKNTYREKNNIIEAKDAMVKDLMEDDKITNKSVAKSVVNWLCDTYSIIKYLGSKYTARTTKRLLVTNEALYYEYLVDEKLVDEVSYIFEYLLSAGDKQYVNIPFMACAPGSGKSRTLQEIFSKTKQGKKFKENSLELLISFGNGTPLREDTEKQFQKALCDRVLYSYFNITVSYEQFLEELKFMKYTFQDVLEFIGEHWRMTHSTSEDLYIYLGIDEFTNLSGFTFKNQNSENRSFLDGVINVIGNAILDFKGKVRLLPFFAGLDYKLFSDSIAKSTFSCYFITPYRFTLLDEQHIVRKYFSDLYYSKELWKVMIFCNRHPRLIGWLINNFKISKDIKKAYEETATNYKTTYGTSNIPEKVAKWILAHVITEQHIAKFDRVIAEGWTAKKLEENGWIYLSKSKAVSAAFPLLLVCGEHIDNSDESDCFRNFLKLLEKACWEKKTHSKEFEVFNAHFDCVLNLCFNYLGHSTMAITERFRGINLGDAKLGNVKIHLDSCPIRVILKEVYFKGSEKTIIESGTMIVNKLEECFFDRFMKFKTDSTETKAILWQDRGTERDMRNFQQNALNNIIEKHFKEQKCSLIGFGRDDCLPIIITTKTNSAKLPDNFGIIDGNGLKTYYGKYVYQLFSLHLPIPFPINQCSRYGAYDLAIFLGITKKSANTIIQNIEKKELMTLDKLKQYKIDSTMVTLETDLIESKIQKENYKIEKVNPDGNCMFAAALLGHSKLLNATTTTLYTVSWLRERVVEEMKKEEYRQELLTQITNMKKEEQYEGLQASFAQYLRNTSEINDETLEKYIENMENDKVWGGDVELKLIAKVLQVSIQVVTPTFMLEINSEEEKRIILAFENNHYDLLVKQ